MNKQLISNKIPSDICKLGFVKKISTTLNALSKFIKLVKNDLKLKIMVATLRGKPHVTPQPSLCNKVTTSPFTIFSHYVDDGLLPLLTCALPTCHHCCKCGHLRSHFEILTTHYYVWLNVNDVSPSFPPCVIHLSYRPHFSFFLHALFIFIVLLVTLLDSVVGTLGVVLWDCLITPLILITLDVTIAIHLSIFNHGVLCTNSTMLKGKKIYF